MDKIELQVTDHSKSWRAPGHVTKSIRYALPFYKSKKGEYTHIIRKANNHWRHGQLSHTSVDFWCGGIGFVGDKGKLYHEVGDGEVLCATCKGRYIGAGMEDQRRINGSLVLFKPRY